VHDVSTLAVILSLLTLFWCITEPWKLQWRCC